jgi:hypothetical protein
MTWNFVAKKFEKAIAVLSDYEWMCYSKTTVAERMAEAEVRNKLNVREMFQVSDE